KAQSHAEPRTSARWAIMVGLAGVIIALVAGIATLKPKTASPPASLPVSRFAITLPAGQRLATPDPLALALSPDGNHLAFAASAGGVQQLYLRAMDTAEMRPIAGTEGATSPFFSPDGQWLGFSVAKSLQKISLSGGAPVPLSALASDWGASWNSQGRIG